MAGKIASMNAANAGQLNPRQYQHMESESQRYRSSTAAYQLVVVLRAKRGFALRQTLAYDPEV